jgi:hypothetical protein
VWGNVDAVNNCPDLAINFPTINEQLTISRGFKAMSGTGFDKVIGTINSTHIWTCKPSKKKCVETICAEKSFLCHRKDKSDMNMQVICNDKLRFIQIELSWPGCTAEYIAWVTYELYANIENSKNIITSVIRWGLTLVGGNVYVKSSSMSVPFKGGMTELVEDSYNFYQGQLRITIERTFGVLEHRWAILHVPLVVPIKKVAPLVSYLCRLHNYCINQKNLLCESSEQLTSTVEDGARNINRLGLVTNKASSTKTSAVNNSIVSFTDDNHPGALLNLGHHFDDCPLNWYSRTSDNVPMDEMTSFL